jgi:hypothetical protein
MHTQIYNFNGLPFLTEEDLILKDYLVATIAHKLKTILHKQNKAWQFHKIEAPYLIPRELINIDIHPSLKEGDSSYETPMSERRIPIGIPYSSICHV